MPPFAPPKQHMLEAEHLNGWSQAGHTAKLYCSGVTNPKPEAAGGVCCCQPANIRIAHGNSSFLK